jgi:hypothetical protein
MIKGNVPLNPAPVGEPKTIFGGENMKKYSWIVALVLALSLGFLGCPDKEPPDEGGWENELDPFELELAPNFQYGHGYQTVYTGILPDGQKISSGDEYELEITFTVSRAVPGGIKMGLVDPTEAAGYWRPLSWTGDAQFDTGALAANATFDDTIAFNCIASASSAAVPANGLVFSTGTATAPEAENDPITLSISKFILTKKGSGDGIEPPPPPPPPPPDAERVDLGDFTWDNGASQKGWKSNGTDSEETDLEINELVTAKYLVLELSAPPSGGLQIVWQGSLSWSWNQENILTDSGEAIPEKGTSIEGNTLKIELSLALKDYDKFQGSEQAKVLIAYYSPDIDGLGIEEAYLLYE